NTVTITNNNRQLIRKQKVQKFILEITNSAEDMEETEDDVDENELNTEEGSSTLYDEILVYLPNVKKGLLRKRTEKANKVYTLFRQIGVD
ncbi:8060_t:CDS:2, partial [Racocetra fulgida]